MGRRGRLVCTGYGGFHLDLTLRNVIHSAAGFAAAGICLSLTTRSLAAATAAAGAPAPDVAELTQSAADARPAVEDRPLFLQIVNPADEARRNQRESTVNQPRTTAPPPAPAPQEVPAGPATSRAENVPTAPPPPMTLAPPPGQRLRSFELPPVEVVGVRPAELKEEDLVGANAQPRWTADRRFPGTRIYVNPPDTVEVEFWLRPTVPRKGKTELRTLAEVEFGFPGRIQLDLYYRNESVTDGPSQTGESVELRYAFADWNKIWGNPTLYVEWSRLEDEADAIETKLLLGGEIAPRWHWGVNFSDELNTGGARENEIEVTGGISYTVLDSKFSVGLETECGVVDTHGHRGTYDDKFFFLGPSMQYRPTEQFHIDFAPLVGLTGDSPAFRAYFVIGYEF